MKRAELSLPEDISVDDKVRCHCVRLAYQFGIAQLTAMRDNFKSLHVPKTYDQPAETRKGVYCIWYKIVRSASAAMPIYNPLWAIDYHMWGAMVKNLPVNAHSFANAANAGLYENRGVVTLRNEHSRVSSTIKVLCEQIEVLELTHGLTPLTAIDEIAEKTSLDPVIELLWRDQRKFAADELLVFKARLAYAAHPELYASDTYPAGWASARKLGDLFRVNRESTKLFRSPAVDELLVDQRAAVEAVSTMD